MKKYDYPDEIEIQPVTKPVNATIRVPGSKSITNRALVLGALASRDVGSVCIEGVLHSEDTEKMLLALNRLGFLTTRFDFKHVVNISNLHDPLLIPNVSAELFVGNSGTTIRFLTALVALGQGEFRLFGIERMHERPIGDLIDGLTQLGVDAKCERNNGCPPVIVKSNGLNGGHVRIRGDISSQFLSALLMVAPYARRETLFQVEGPVVSEPYVTMTVQMMREFGVGVAQPSKTSYRVPVDQTYNLTKYNIEPDATSSSYFFAAAAIAGGQVRIPNIPFLSIQGDIEFVRLLKAMGCGVDQLSFERVFSLESHLRGITVDMNAISDTVMTLAAVACFAEGPTTIRNVAHIRHKECDRITALCTELRKLGVEVEEYPDGLKITPRPMHGAVIETYNDHRMAMSMALIGLKVPGVVIKNPGCVAKTYPGFWEDFQKLYQ